MDSMVVTLAVLKLSGWLNSSAFCPAKGRAFKVGGMCAWRREPVGWLPCEERAGEGPKGDQGVRGTGRAHPKHARHGGDAGRVEAQRLVERKRVLPSQKEGIHGRRHVRWEARACGVVAVQGAGRRGSEGRSWGARHRRSARRT